jgi:hypothetical protein
MTLCQTFIGSNRYDLFGYLTCYSSIDLILAMTDQHNMVERWWNLHNTVVEYAAAVAGYGCKGVSVYFESTQLTTTSASETMVTVFRFQIGLNWAVSVYFESTQLTTTSASETMVIAAFCACVVVDDTVHGRYLDISRGKKTTWFLLHHRWPNSMVERWWRITLLWPAMDAGTLCSSYCLHISEAGLLLNVICESATGTCNPTNKMHLETCYFKVWLLFMPLFYDYWLNCLDHQLLSPAPLVYLFKFSRLVVECWFFIMDIVWLLYKPSLVADMFKFSSLVENMLWKLMRNILHKRRWRTSLVWFKENIPSNDCGAWLQRSGWVILVR